ncbi:MAG: PRC-barrel domain-containing protein [Planctomycetota bacterium]|nr:PRC-barrel domain-containing protein [Planctomycetota bacterium]
MLRSLSEIRGYAIEAVDGRIGDAHDFLFDDQVWTVRYVVVDTGRWLPGRRVLVSPMAVARPDWKARLLPANMTKEQIESSPPISADEPVARQHEVALHEHYGWAPYWPIAGAYGLATGETPPAVVSEAAARKEAREAVNTRRQEADPHLRSSREVEGYHVQAVDGEIGHVEDFILDDAGWVVRYLVVDTRNWLPGRKVLVAPLWSENIDWEDRRRSCLSRPSSRAGWWP